mgnify:CR=1 FL=1
MTVHRKIYTGLYSRAAHSLFWDIMYLCRFSDVWRFRFKIEECVREDNGETTVVMSFEEKSSPKSLLSDAFGDAGILGLLGISAGDGERLRDFFAGKNVPDIDAWRGEERDPVTAGLWKEFRREQQKYVDEYHSKIMSAHGDRARLSSLYWEHAEAQDRIKAKYSGDLDFDD